MEKYLNFSGKRRWFLLPVAALMLYLAALFVLSPQNKVESVSYAKVFYDRNNQLLGAKLADDDKWRFESSLKDVSPSLKTALIEFEDKRFYSHFGIDLISVARAFAQNISSFSIKSGASTITMQTARLLWKTHRFGRWLGKFYQVFRAVQLEIFYSKDFILQLYFNLAPYGKNIEGVTAASWLFYNKPPSELNWSEAIHMAIAPKDPNKFRLDRFPLQAQEYCKELVGDLKARKRLKPSELLFLSCNIDHARLRTLPKYARHLVDRLVTDSGLESQLVQQPLIAGNKQFNHITTTVDLNLQLDVETILQQHIDQMTLSVQHSSIIVVDNKSGDVLVYIGSPDFDNFESNGQVDGIRSPRSPGSTLKPFLYARALETGDYNSNSLLSNVPMSYVGFRPTNFNRENLGIIHFDKALQHSLNIPAIALDAELGPELDLYNFLETASLSTLTHNRQYYGHNIVLGSLEARMDELAALYRMLANQGNLKGINLVKSGKPTSSKQLLTPEAVYIITAILRKSPIPKYDVASGTFMEYPDIAWKTGTSSKRKDTWTFGYNEDFTVGVWFGDISGLDQDVSGRSMAAPLLFKVFRHLQRERSTPWRNMPKDVIKKRVCMLSGDIPHKDCEGTVETLWIAGKTKPEFCKNHVHLYVEKKSGMRLSRQCIKEQDIPKTEITERSAIQWSRETHSWLAHKGSSFSFPPYKKGCAPPDVLNGDPPRLQTPLNGETYMVQADSVYDTSKINFNKIVFQASVSNEVNYVNWYLDNHFLTRTKPGKLYVWTPEAGNHKLVVIDNLGRKSEAAFTVRIE